MTTRTPRGESDLRRSRTGRERLRSGQRPAGGASKSGFPAEARYWGRVNTQGDFEEAASFPASRWDNLVPVLRHLVRRSAPVVLPAFVGALTALAVVLALGWVPRTTPAAPPTIIVNPVAPPGSRPAVGPTVPDPVPESAASATQAAGASATQAAGITAGLSAPAVPAAAGPARPAAARTGRVPAARRLAPRVVAPPSGADRDVVLDPSF